jgi:hypothetical protein
MGKPTVGGDEDQCIGKRDVMVGMRVKLNES